MKAGEKSLPETASWKETDLVTTGDSWTDVWAKWTISVTDWREDLDVNSFNTNNESQTTNGTPKQKQNQTEWTKHQMCYFLLFPKIIL